MKRMLSVLVAVAMLLCAAVSATAFAATPEETLTIAVGSDPSTLNPGIAASNERFERLVYNGLVCQEGTEIVPDLAESWECSEDGLVWTFHLRDGVKFHSGKQLTANDVKVTLERYLDPDHPLTHSGHMTWIKQVDVVDDLTVNIVCNGPYALALSALAGHWGLILNADDVIAYGDDCGSTTEKTDGTGPYRIKEHVWNEKFIFEANPDYFEGEPSIKELDFVFIPNAASRTIALESGEVDLVCGVNASDVGLLQDEGFPVEFTLSNGQYFFMYNCSEYSVCHDPRVRQALNYAVDNEAIVAALYADVQGEVPTSFATARDYGTEDLGVIPHDVEKAKELLAEAGYADGLTIKLFASDIYTKNVEAAQIIKQYCAEVGVTIDIVTGDNAMFSEIFDHTAEDFAENIGYDMFCMGQGPADCDLGGYQGLYETDTRSNSSNYGFYSNAEVDKLFEEQAVETDPEARLALLHRLNEVMYLEDPVGMLIWNDKTPFAMNNRITNFAENVNVMGLIDYDKLVLAD